MVGSGSGNDGCPTLYELPGTGDYLVQGDAVTDPEEIAQLTNVKPGEQAVTVPRALLANFGPKEAIPTRERIGFEDFGRMFTKLKHSAWRLETRRRYASDEETDTYREFLRAGSVAWNVDDPWCMNRRAQTALGKRFARVRIVDDPLTEGQRYLLDNARRNTAVGEEIRTLPRTTAEYLHLPEEDFWLFDARVVALLRFDDADVMTGVDLITNPVEVVRYCQVREAAWHHSVPYEDAAR